MPTITGTITNANGELAHINMLKVIRDFAGGFGQVGTIGYTGTGNGTMTNVDSAVAAPSETWTITCTAVSTDGGVFSVSGSVSGAYTADAIVGTPYTSDLINFTINDGTIDFQVGDVFTIPITVNPLAVTGDEWEVLRFDNTHDVTTANATWQLILKGAGLSGTEEIYAGLYTYESVPGDYYNFTIANLRGFLEASAFDAQPGISPRISVCGHNIAITYWLSVNAQRINCVMKVGTPVFEIFTIGKFFPYAYPSDYPQPLLCVGMMSGAKSTIRYSDLTTSHSMGFRGDVTRGHIFRQDGSWVNPKFTPWSYDSFTSNDTSYLNNAVLPTGDGTATYTYAVMPIEVYQVSPANVYGVVDGIFFITGFDNVVENTLTIGGRDFVVIQDAFRTGFADYIALELN